VLIQLNLNKKPKDYFAKFLHNNLDSSFGRSDIKMVLALEYASSSIRQDSKSFKHHKI